MSRKMREGKKEEIVEQSNPPSVNRKGKEKEQIR
jgi:hypothetical protein